MSIPRRVKSHLALSVALSLSAAGMSALQSCEAQPSEAQSTIGGTPVPDNLHCEEDEVIHFDENTWSEGADGRMSHELGCVHIDSIRYPAR